MLVPLWWLCLEMGLSVDYYFFLKIINFLWYESYQIFTSLNSYIFLWDWAFIICIIILQPIDKKIVDITFLWYFVKLKQTTTKNYLNQSSAVNLCNTAL